MRKPRKFMFYLAFPALLLFSQSASADGWIALSSGTSNLLSCCWFWNGSVGCVAGSMGIFLKTTDGGQSWTISNPAAPNSINSLFFINPDTGYVVGDFGTIMKTVNGGESWNPETSSTQNMLRSVYFVRNNAFNNLTGCAVGDMGTVVAKSNNDTKWQVRALSSDMSFSFLRAICLPDPSNGYIGGGLSGNAVILTSGSGATVWSSIAPTGIGWDIQSMFFINTTTGFVTGCNGTIYKTSNSATSWARVNNSPARCLNSIRFVDSNVGYAVGDNGTILRTVNSGSTWETQTSGTQNRLMSVFFLNSDTGYAVGANGLILKTVNGGLASGISYPAKHPFRADHITVQMLRAGSDALIVLNIPNSCSGKPTHATLYDQRGALLCHLFDTKTTAGNHVFRLAAGGFSSAVLICVVTVGDFQEVQTLFTGNVSFKR